MLEIQLGVSEIMIFVQGHGRLLLPFRVADWGGGGGRGGGGGGGGCIFKPLE